MQAALRQKQQPAHMKPSTMDHQLSSQGLSADSLKMMWGVTLLRSLQRLRKKEGCMSCMSFSYGTKAREQVGAQTSHPYETVGRTTASKRRLILGKDTSHIRALCLADKRAAAPLPFCNSLAKASVMPPDS